jgi:hypothetical protein
MRVGIVRTDVGHMYLNDVENRSQRCFSSQPAGQSRYFHKPTAAELNVALATTAFVTVRAADFAAAVNTSAIPTDNKLNIRASSTAPFVQIAVTSGAAVAKATIVNDLNLQFINNSLPLHARLSGAGPNLQVTIDSTIGGPNAFIEIDAAIPAAATLQTIIGLAVPSTTAGLTGTTLVTVGPGGVYPTALTIDVSSAHLLTLSTFALMTTAQQNAVVAAIADLVAPSLIETGPVLLSFAYGNLSKMRSATFHPGGIKPGTATFIGLPAGIAAAIVAADGVTPFTL